MWLAVIGVFVAALVAASLWLARTRRVKLGSWLGSAVLVAWVVGVAVKVHFERAQESAPAVVASLPSIAWPSKPVAGAPSPAVATPKMRGAKEAAPVSSLVGGLEQRLAAHPNDANGWALLAQSYAFMGDPDAAEKAVNKAVSLGVDEQALRARVDGARGAAHPTRPAAAVVD